MDPDSIDTGAAARFKGALNKTFYSLRTRNFRLYFFGQIISNSGNWLTNIALTLLVLKISGSGFAVGLVAACQYGPILLFSAWAGAITDRVDKRRMLQLTQTLEMCQSIGLAFLAFMPHPPMYGLYALALVGGTLLAFDNPARRSFVSDMVPREDIPNAVVLYSTIVNTSRIIGPAIAGLLVVTAGYGWCFTIDAASYLAVLFSLYRMRPSELHRTAPKPKAKGEIRAGLRYVRQSPVLWISFVMLIIIQTFSYNFAVTLPLLIIHALHSTTGIFTILYSVFSLGAVVSGLVVAGRGLVGMKNIIFGAAAIGITMLVLSVVPGVIAAGPVLFLVGTACVLYLTGTTAIAQMQTKRDMVGRVLALQTVILGGSSLIGGPLLGWLADVLGGRAPIVIGGVAALIAAAFGVFASRRYLQTTVVAQ